MNFSDFTDFVLVVLYTTEILALETEPNLADKFLPLDFIDAALRQKYPRRWFLDAARILQARGLAESFFEIGSSGSARITGGGRILVERRRGERLASFRQNVANVFDMQKLDDNLKRIVNSTSSRTIEEERSPAFSLVDQLEEIAKTSNLSDERKIEVDADLETVRQQLRKREPNRAVMAAVLEPLASIPEFTSAVADLVQLLNP